jgi:hypothetical protein
MWRQFGRNTEVCFDPQVSANDFLGHPVDLESVIEREKMRLNEFLAPL